MPVVATELCKKEIFELFLSLNWICTSRSMLNARAWWFHEKCIREAFIDRGLYPPVSYNRKVFTCSRIHIYVSFLSIIA